MDGKQDWQDKELDKDLIGDGFVYSPKNCIFLSKKVNSFLVRANDIGFTWNKYHSKFQAQCSDPFGSGNKFLGYFDTPEEAHLAWKAKKHEYACKLADLQDNILIANALRNRFK